MPEKALKSVNTQHFKVPCFNSDLKNNFFPGTKALYKGAYPKFLQAKELMTLSTMNLIEEMFMDFLNENKNYTYMANPFLVESHLIKAKILKRFLNITSKSLGSLLSAIEGFYHSKNDKI